VGMKTRFLVAVTGAVVLALAGCSGGSSNSNSSTNTAANSSSPVTQPEIYAQQKMDMASLNQAVEQYHAAEGKYPDNLQELAPSYIARIPDAPPGYKINYDAGSGVVSLARQ
jgi:ABC-type glycerol-3-phosphate transport system substrate-binding protein